MKINCIRSESCTRAEEEGGGGGGNKEEIENTYYLTPCVSWLFQLQKEEEAHCGIRRGVLSAFDEGVFASWLMSSVAKVPWSPRGCRVRTLSL